MELSIESDPLSGILSGVHLCAQLREMLPLFRTYIMHGLADGEGLEELPQLIDLSHFRNIDLADDGSPMGIELNHPLGCQVPESFADRRRAHIELCGDIGLYQMRASWKLPGYDLVMQKPLYEFVGGSVVVRISAHVQPEGLVGRSGALASGLLALGIPRGHGYSNAP